MVRHGADPLMALAVVLGVAAEDIEVREVAVSEPLVTASTVPTAHPSNPNPNMWDTKQ